MWSEFISMQSNIIKSICKSKYAEEQAWILIMSKLHEFLKLRKLVECELTFYIPSLVTNYIASHYLILVAENEA